MKSKMDPLVSVVIPVYNVESYLHEKCGRTDLHEY